MMAYRIAMHRVSPVSGVLDVLHGMSVVDVLEASAILDMVDAEQCRRDAEGDDG